MAELEHAFVRAPFEATSKFLRNTHKQVEKEWGALDTLMKRLSKPDKKTKKKKKKNGGDDGASKTLSQLAKRLKGLKRKLTDDAGMYAKCAKYAQRLRVRASHLQELAAMGNPGALPAAARRASAEAKSSSSSSSTRRSRGSAPPLSPRPACSEVALPLQTKLDRVLVDHLLRQGFYDVASHLVSGVNLADFADMEVFRSAQQVCAQLQQHCCDLGLIWCVSNRSKLRRTGSCLEFELRLQQYVEMLKKGDTTGAVAHAQKYFGAWEDVHKARIRAAMSALAFAPAPLASTAAQNGTDSGTGTPTTEESDAPSLDWVPKRYAHLFAESRWEALRQQFLDELYGLNGLTNKSMLELSLQAGLSALQTPACGSKASRNPNCPTCVRRMHVLAQQVTRAERVHSCIVCPITGAVMDEDNPPLVLPNGYAYSSAALRAMAQRSGNDKVTCPRTQQSFPLEKCRRAYVM